jgi:hypothetical protein
MVKKAAPKKALKAVEAPKRGRPTKAMAEAKAKKMAKKGKC